MKENEEMEECTKESSENLSPHKKDKEKHSKAPIYEALLKYKAARVVPFDVPGHKQGRGNPMLKEFLGEKCLSVDVNSMKPLDNLCHPVSVIKEAEELAADAFGAKHAFFMVNGTTSAVQAMVMSVCKKGEKIIKNKEHETRLRFEFIDTKIMDNPVATQLQIRSEVERMARLARNNFCMACESFLIMDDSKKRELADNEELINWLNHSISDFMVTVTSRELTGDVSEYIGRLFHVITDLERIGDHAENIMGRIEIAKENDISFTDQGMNEFKEIYELDLELLDRSIGAFLNMKLNDDEEHQLHYIEDTIDYLTLQAQDNHVERLREKKCHTSSGVIFTKALQDLERVGDHSYNIAWAARTDKKLIRQI